MPTTAQQQYSGVGRLDPVYAPELAKQQEVNIVASVTLAKGTVLGELTATPGTFKAYASGNGDGSQVAKAILVYSVTTDASGNITMVGEFGQTSKGCPVYISGFFKTADLTGLDAAGLTNLGGSLKSGTLSSGIVGF
jgi:hypothetical protein